jgi:hypothetical protein
MMSVGTLQFLGHACNHIVIVKPRSEQMNVGVIVKAQDSQEPLDVLDS